MTKAIQKQIRTHDSTLNPVSGVKADRTRLVLFVVSGLMAALAGIYYVLYYTSARGDNATGMELQVIAAVVLGGVSVFGGRGALHGVVAGVLLIGVLSKALQLVNITSDVVSIITGVLLVRFGDRRERHELGAVPTGQTWDPHPARPHEICSGARPNNRRVQCRT